MTRCNDIENIFFSYFVTEKGLTGNSLTKICMSCMYVKVKNIIKAK